MQTRPTSSIKVYSSHSKQSTPRIRSYSQHGSAQSHSPLLALPHESLTHITAYLDPPSLYKLALCCRRLKDHAAQENVWHRAFLWAYLSIGPEEDDREKVRQGELMLRRRHNTWKKEYICRWMLIRRIQHSRNPTITHVPTHSGISSHMLFPTTLSLLSASLTYGIVARSLPMTGRVLKGYLDAHGMLNGLGVGNPNAEFSVDVSAIALGKEGDTIESATGRVVWGFRNGGVAVTRGIKPSEVGRAGKLVSSAQTDAHAQRVEALCLGALGTVASASVDGHVKIWDGAGRDNHTLPCLWTSAQASAGTVTGALGKIAYEGGFVVAASSGGQLLLWHGVDPGLLLHTGASLTSNIPIVISLYPDYMTPRHIPMDTTQQPTTLLLNPYSDSVVLLLVHFTDEDHFWRLRISFTSHPMFGHAGVEVERTRFAGGPLGPITSIAASFAPLSPGTLESQLLTTPLPPPPPHIDHQTTMFEMSDLPPRPLPAKLSLKLNSDLRTPEQKPHSYIITGDALGRVCVWNWEAIGVRLAESDSGLSRRREAEVPIVSAWRKWEAQEDGGVSAVTLQSGLLVTGSSQGSIKLWDPLPPRTCPVPLRVLPSPSPRPQTGLSWEGVTQISLEGDLLVASVGSRVIAWRGGNLGKEKLGKSKGKSRSVSHGTRSGLAKGAQRMELHRDISDSRHLVQDEQQYMRASLYRGREHRERLDELGLDEIGAVEYALMLSRDEEERRALDGAGTGNSDTNWSDIGSMSGLHSDQEDKVPVSSPLPSQRSSFASSPVVSPAMSRQPSKSSDVPCNLSSSAHSSPLRLSSPWLGASFSNAKVQVSPRLSPEPLRAGSSFFVEASTSPSLPSLDASRYGSFQSSHSVHSAPPTTAAHFPSLPSSTHSSAQASSLSSPAQSMSGSPESNWPSSSVSHKTGRSSTATTPAGHAMNDVARLKDSDTTRAIPHQDFVGPSLLSAKLASLSETRGYQIPKDAEDEEEMLKLAMELSMAEAFSSGLHL